MGPAAPGKSYLNSPNLVTAALIKDCDAVHPGTGFLAENPYFATSIGNRIWAHFFGVGIIEPVDDIRVSNPPTNPELIEALGKKLIEYNYDFKRMVKDICTNYY